MYQISNRDWWTTVIDQLTYHKSSIIFVWFISQFIVVIFGKYTNRNPSNSESALQVELYDGAWRADPSGCAALTQSTTGDWGKSGFPKMGG